mmetsp:Transcript_14882/g.34065  ORF Transcript_14882/g.34065 Transcript_14882/m.34065 type:complete len:410 (-) Transcript_14882:20-1249(-)
MTFDDTQPVTGRPGDEYSSAAYRDYSTYLQNGGELITHKKSDRNFPVKLHRIVSDPLNSLVITWMPHGRAFKVLKRDELVRDVIPGYFDCAKYESFTRQLTAWDFRRCKRGPDQGCYYHEAFLRGLPELTCFIRRMPRHCRKSDRKRIEPEEEPDFYGFSPLHPAPPSHSTQQGERSSAHQQLELNEQAGQRDNEEKRRPGGDGGMLEGQMGDDFSSVPSGSSPPPYCNRGEYQSNEYLHHDQRKEGHSLGASAPAWGGVRPCIGDGDLWSTPCHGKERPPYDLGASTSEYQYKATPQYSRPQELSHSSPHHHTYDYGHCSYGYYTPPGYQSHYYAQTDTYNPHYPSHQPYYQHPHSYYHPPPAYPAAYNGAQWHSPSQTHKHDTYHYYPTWATGWTSEEEAGQHKQSR